MIKPSLRSKDPRTSDGGNRGRRSRRNENARKGIVTSIELEAAGTRAERGKEWCLAQARQRWLYTRQVSYARQYCTEEQTDYVRSCLAFRLRRSTKTKTPCIYSLLRNNREQGRVWLV